MNSASARASSVLPTPVGPEEQERADRAARVLEPGPRPADRVGHGLDGLVLAHDPLVQALLHVDQLGRLALHQAADRDAGPGGDDVGDVVRPDLLLEQGAGTLEAGQGLLLDRQPVAEFLVGPVLELGGRGEVGLAFGLLDARRERLELRLRRADRGDRGLLAFPALLHAAGDLLEVGQLLLEDRQPGLRGVVGLLAQRFALDLELDPPALELVELDGHRIDLHAKSRRRFVDEVDRLVRQEPVGDVAVRQGGGRDQRRVGDADAVMDLVALAQAAQDRDRLLDGRLVHEHRLEAPLQGGVLLDVLAVLVEGRRADRVQLAAGEHRLEQVGRIHRALGRAGPDDGVELVDEQDHLALGVLDLLEHGLEPFLELAAELGAGDDGAEIQRDHALVLERLGDVAADDPLGEAFGDGRLADARLADQDRVVLRPAGQDLDDAADLVVAPDDRIQLAGSRFGGEVPTVLLERGIGAFRVGRRDALAAAHALERAEDGLLAGPVSLEQGLCLATDLGRADEQVFGRDVVVAEAAGLVLGPLDDVLRARIQAQRASGDPRPAGQHRGELAAERRQVHAEAPERLGRDAVIGRHERVEQVFGIQHRAVEPLGSGLRGHDGLLGFLGESVELHVGSLRYGSARGGLVDEVEQACGRRASLIGQVGRQDDLGLHVEVAVAGGLEAGHPTAGEAERAPVLGARRDGEGDPALERVDLHLGPEQGLGQGQWQLAVQVRPATDVPSVRQAP